jgi:hypothetical protein
MFVLSYQIICPLFNPRYSKKKTGIFLCFKKGARLLNNYPESRNLSKMTLLQGKYIGVVSPLISSTAGACAPLYTKSAAQTEVFTEPEFLNF